MTTGEVRCKYCNKRLFDVENLEINPEGSIVVKCKCKRKNILTSSGLELVDEDL